MEGRGLAGLNIALIGAGTMGEVILRGLLGHRLVEPERVTAADVSKERRTQIRESYGVEVTDSAEAAARNADLILLAVKPQVIDQVLTDLEQVVGPKQVVISIAAGVTTGRIERSLREGVPVVRVMPNTPCQVEAGASALTCGANAGREESELTEAIFSPLGLVVEVEEKLMNAVTGLSGSGPAFVYIMIEALADAGVQTGLGRDVARKLAAHTVRGAAEMVLATGEHPAELKNMVASPGGTTIAGIKTLERLGLRSALMEAVEAAANRAAELGGE